MKRLVPAIVLLLALAAGLSAQERSTEVHGEMLGWKWANFALLALGIGYFAAKNLPAFFRSRTEEIRRGIDEAAKLKAEAEAKAALIESRLANVSVEIEKLRSQLKAEMQAEGARIRQDTERQLARVKEQAGQEIAFMAKASRQELKTFSADLALELARQRIRSRMTPDTQHRLVEAFVRDLREPGESGAAA